MTKSQHKAAAMAASKRMGTTKQPQRVIKTWAAHMRAMIGRHS